jgi:hypothetical protein
MSEKSDIWLTFKKPWKQYAGRWFIDRSGKVSFYLRYIKYDSYTEQAIYWGWSKELNIFKNLYLFPTNPPGVVGGSSDQATAKTLQPYKPNTNDKRKVMKSAFITAA